MPDPSWLALAAVLVMLKASLGLALWRWGRKSRESMKRLDGGSKR